MKKVLIFTLAMTMILLVACQPVSDENKSVGKPLDNQLITSTPPTSTGENEIPSQPVGSTTAGSQPINTEPVPQPTTQPQPTTPAPTNPTETTAPVTQPTTPAPTTPQPQPTTPTPTTSPIHQHSYTTKVVAPTCTAEGYTLHTCSGCSHSYKDTIKAASGHKETSAVTKPASCTATGTRTYTCSVCGAKRTETISKTAHNYGQWKTSVWANPEENGQQFRECADCDAVERRTTAKVQTNQPYLYMPNNILPNENDKGEVCINIRCVFWYNGELIIQFYLLNDTNQTVKFNSANVTVISGNTVVAADENFSLEGWVLGPHQRDNDIWQWRIPASQVQVANVNLNTTTYAFLINCDPV